jgi:hypothetical protein
MFIRPCRNAFQAERKKMPPAKARAGMAISRNPVEEVAGRAFGAGPDRDRKQHDVARGKAGDGDGADQLRQRLVVVVDLGIEQVCGIAQPAKHRNERRHIVAAPADGDPPCRKIDANTFDILELAKHSLDGLDASRAVHGRHGEVRLLEVGAQGSACKPDFLARRQHRSGACEVDRHVCTRSTAAHWIAPWEIMTRRTSR